jgi:hypothetical protein
MTAHDPPAIIRYVMLKPGSIAGEQMRLPHKTAENKVEKGRYGLDG